MPRILTAKRAFTLWAFVVFGFLYLPIAVMALFAFNKPSPRRSRRSPAPTSATSRRPSWGT